MHRALRLTLVALVLAVLDMPRVGHAVGTPGQICAGGKLKAAAKAANARVVCHAKAALKGIAADPACLAKAETKLSDAFGKAESKGGCATVGDADDIDGLLDSSVGAFVEALRPVTTANRCASVKLKATGKKAKTKLGCHAKAVKQGRSVDPGCLAKAEVRFAVAFSKVETRPPCLTTGDAAEVEQLVDDLVNGVLVVNPTTTTTTTTIATTTTTTLPAVCGNGQLEPAGGEDCDGDQLGGLLCFGASGMTSCFPPGDPNQCKCCIPPGGTGIFANSDLQVCCDGEPLLYIGPGPSPTYPEIGCPGCSVSSFPQCGGTCAQGTQCAPVSDGGEDRCACVPPPPVTLCDGGSGYPVCDGTCPAGQECGVDVDLSGGVVTSCACFPAGETPCGSTEYPQCGGACLRNHECQALGSGGSGGCVCVDATIPCGGFVAGVCPEGLACAFVSTPFGFLFGCGTP